MEIEPTMLAIFYVRPSPARPVMQSHNIIIVRLGGIIPTIFLQICEFVMMSVENDETQLSRLQR